MSFSVLNSRLPSAENTPWPKKCRPGSASICAITAPVTASSTARKVPGRRANTATAFPVGDSATLWPRSGRSKLNSSFVALPSIAAKLQAPAISARALRKRLIADGCTASAERAGSRLPPASAAAPSRKRRRSVAIEAVESDGDIERSGKVCRCQPLYVSDRVAQLYQLLALRRVGGGLVERQRDCVRRRQCAIEGIVDQRRGDVALGAFAEAGRKAGLARAVAVIHRAQARQVDDDVLQRPAAAPGFGESRIGRGRVEPEGTRQLDVGDQLDRGEETVDERCCRIARIGEAGIGATGLEDGLGEAARSIAPLALCLRGDPGDIAGHGSDEFAAKRRTRIVTDERRTVGVEQSLQRRQS